MPLEITAQTVRLVKRDNILPPTIEEVLRRFIVDKRTGNIQLNIQDGKILGFTEHRMHKIAGL